MRAQAENIAVDVLEKMEFGFTHDQMPPEPCTNFDCQNVMKTY